MQSVEQSRASKAFLKDVWVGWISSFAEAYNMAIYSFVAPFYAPFLFQKSESSNAIFFSYFLTFLASCLIYPAGAAYYGLLGDREGRQKICIFSTLGLAIATGLMGLIPVQMLEYSWVYFFILISAQYFFSGGEYYGSIIFSLEHSGQKQNGLTSAFSSIFAVLGLVSSNGLAVLAIALDSQYYIQACFLLGGAAGVISYALKYHSNETPIYCALDRSRWVDAGLLTFIKEEGWKIGRVVLVFGFFMVAYTFIFIFLPLVRDEPAIETFSTLKSLVAYGLFLFIGGLIADRIGEQKTMLIGLCTFSALIFPAIILSSTLLTLQMSLTASACLVIAPIHSWMLQQFSVDRRCRGVFIGSAAAIAVFGGSTMPICLIIFNKYQSLVLSGFYPLFAALGALGSLWFSRSICSFNRFSYD